LSKKGGLKALAEPLLDIKLEAGMRRRVLFSLFPLSPLRMLLTVIPVLRINTGGERRFANPLQTKGKTGRKGGN